MTQFQLIGASGEPDGVCIGAAIPAPTAGNRAGSRNGQPRALNTHTATTCPSLAATSKISATIATNATLNRAQVVYHQIIAKNSAARACPIAARSARSNASASIAAISALDDAAVRDDETRARDARSAAASVDSGRASPAAATLSANHGKLERTQVLAIAVQYRAGCSRTAPASTSVGT